MIVDIVVGIVAILIILFLFGVYEEDARERKRKKDLRNRWRE